MLDDTKAYKCPKCTNKTLYRIPSYSFSNMFISTGDLFICDECCAELYANVDYDNSVRFTNYNRDKV